MNAVAFDTDSAASNVNEGDDNPDDSLSTSSAIRRRFHITAVRANGEERHFQTLFDAEEWLDEEIKLGEPLCYISSKKMD